METCMHELAMRLSPHFTLREAVRSQTATRRGIDNEPLTRAGPRDIMQVRVKQ